MSSIKISSIILAIACGLSAIVLACTGNMSWPAALTILAGAASTLGIHIDSTPTT